MLIITNKRINNKKAKVSPEVAQLRRFLSENKVFIEIDSKTGKASIKAEKKQW